MAEKQDIRFVRGDSWAGLSVTWNDASGTPVTIASARMQIRPAVASETVSLELTDGAGITVSGGTVAPAITPAQSQLLASGVYDLEATSAAGVVKTLVYGVVKVQPDVTRG